MKILVQGSNILAVGSLTETADAITSDDAVYPKHVIPGWQIVEAALPDDYAPGRYALSAGVFTLNSMPVEPEARAAFILQVRSEAGALTTQVLQGLGSEYERAEKEATAYKAAGYTGAIPGSVADEVASKAARNITITATVGCDNILAAASGWRDAQSSLRRNRLTMASAAKVAVDGAALDAIRAEHESFMAALKISLGV